MASDARVGRRGQVIEPTAPVMQPMGPVTQPTCPVMP